MNPGFVSGIVGSLVGVAGGLIGTYFSIKNTKGPRERAFMIRAALVCWIGLNVFFVAMFLLPQSRLLLWIPYLILLPLGILYLNKNQQSGARSNRIQSLKRCNLCRHRAFNPKEIASISSLVARQELPWAKRPETKST
jgi:hypothetical protein